MIFHVISWNWDFPVICVVWHKCFRHCCCHRSLSVSLMPRLLMAKKCCEIGRVICSREFFHRYACVRFSEFEIAMQSCSWRLPCDVSIRLSFDVEPGFAGRPDSHRRCLRRCIHVKHNKKNISVCFTLIYNNEVEMFCL